MDFSKRKNIPDLNFSPDALQNQTSILDLPFCLVAAIFSRLPITMVVACKSVCKLWQAYILDPKFGSVYAKETPYVSLILFNLKFRCSLAELKPGYDPSLTPKPAKVIKDRFSSHALTDVLLGSCNGLLCFLHSFPHGKELTLWNPLTGELGLLPPPKEESNVQVEAYLFGFCQERKEYKVLRIFTRRFKPKEVHTRICTIGTDEEWRVLNSCIPLPQGTKKPHKFLNCPQICGLSFKGALHWLTDEYCRGFLVAFDIGEERAWSVPHPREMPMAESHTFGVGILRGCLCIFQSVHPDAQLLDIWTMNKYGVADSWSKETITFSIPLRYKRYYPFVSLGSEEMLTCEDNGTLVAYNPKDNRSTQVFTSGCRILRGNAVPYVPCFLSFDKLMKGSGGELKFATIVTQYISTKK